MIDVADHSVRLQATLKEFGERVAERVPLVGWHVEFPASRIYTLFGMCVFTDQIDPTVERAVISVHLQNAPSALWEMDVTDRESQPLQIWAPESPELMAEMALDPALAQHEVRSFLVRGFEPLVQSLLSPR